MIVLLQMFVAQQDESSELAMFWIDENIGLELLDLYDRAKTVMAAEGFDEIRWPLPFTPTMLSESTLWPIEDAGHVIDYVYNGPIVVNDLPEQRILKGFTPAGWWARVSRDGIRLWTYDHNNGHWEFESAEMAPAFIERILDGEEEIHFSHVRVENEAGCAEVSN